ncbi:hypothetical protein G6F68_017680 [Rhizopus microsporus]|nr:hypothetical protein G6F68_017680 [Rhizopus microsporus]
MEPFAKQITESTPVRRRSSPLVILPGNQPGDPSTVDHSSARLRDSTSTDQMATAPATSMLDSTTSDSVKWLVMMGAMMAGANRPPKRATAPAMPMPLARRSVG